MLTIDLLLQLRSNILVDVVEGITTRSANLLLFVTLPTQCYQ